MLPLGMHEISRQNRPADDRNEYNLDFVEYRTSAKG